MDAVAQRGRKEKIRTRSSLGVETEWTDAGCDGLVRLERPNSQA